MEKKKILVVRRGPSVLASAVVRDIQEILIRFQGGCYTIIPITKDDDVTTEFIDVYQPTQE